MKFSKIAVLLFVLISSPLAVPNAYAELIPNPDGMTVYDTVLKVNWLKNANLAGTPDLVFAPAFSGTIAPNGSMDYSTAVRWVKYLKDNNYLGHNDWTLPATPMTDGTCSKPAGGPHGNSFGFGCTQSDMGSLFYGSASLGLQHPNTAVPIPNNTVGPFRNFQPYLYWSETSTGGSGYNTFSFNTGWMGSNVSGHYMYVLPMLPGLRPILGPYHLAGMNDLQVSADGQTVYDPVADVTWLANANLATTRKFGAQCVKPDPAHTQCINPDGSMSHKTAEKWINGMNASAGYLGQTDWDLPTTPTTLSGDSTCSLADNAGLGFGFGCQGSPLGANPMGELFYHQLGLSQGSRVIATPPDVSVGPFHNVQPYLYWSSCEQPPSPSACTTIGNDGVTRIPAPGYEWSFSFGNGFQGTDVVGNNLYVMVYYPETPAQAADTTPPVTTAGVSGPLGSSGWYVGPTVVNFTAADDLSGVFQTEFSLDNGATWTTGNSTSLTVDGVYRIRYRSTDFVGNVETPKSIIVKLDTSPPVTTVTTHVRKVLGVPIGLEVDLRAFDNLSGVASTDYSLDHGSTWKTGNVLFLCGGTRTLLFRSTDVAGNVEKRQSITVSTPLCGGP